ncbi:MAG: flagellar motor protein [Proteobacteria bacterium]|nr:flagellar motor protein [Pseudomonadota bacterium]
MDLLSLIGVVLAFAAILVGAVLKGAGIHALLSSAAFMIVVMGTIAAIMIQTPGVAMRRALVILPWIFKPPHLDPNALIALLIEWGNVARKSGLLALESAVVEAPDDFTQKGLAMVIDGGEPEVIRHTLELDLSSREAADLRAAKVYEGMGIYAPTMGIIGAVLGLMAVMQNLADPSKLGQGIAAAFTATIYGIGIANLFLLPIGSKLKAVIHHQSHMREMIVEGLIALAQGENPRRMEARLQSYLH